MALYRFLSLRSQHSFGRCCKVLRHVQRYMCRLQDIFPVEFKDTQNITFAAEFFAHYVSKENFVYLSRRNVKIQRSISNTLNLSNITLQVCIYIYKASLCADINKSLKCRLNVSNKVYKYQNIFFQAEIRKKQRGKEMWHCALTCCDGLRYWYVPRCLTF